MNEDLKTFANWAIVNRLTVNISKTKYMIFHGSKKKANGSHSTVKISYNETELQRVDKYNYLGFLIDDVLSFDSHINQLLSSSFSKIYMLGKLRKYIDPKTAIVIFKSYILPRLEYCDFLLTGSKNTSICKLQKAMNYALRICFNAPYGTSNFKLHISAKILPLNCRRDISLLKQMFCCSTDDRYINVSQNRRGRSKGHIKIRCDLPRLEKYKKSICYQGPKKWDLLPNEIKNSENIIIFKKRLHLYYRNKFLMEKSVYA